MDTYNTNINWYPGHMKKSIESIRDSLKMVDIVLEIIDARIPISSRNPVLDEIIGDFPRLIIFNKADMAKHEETQRWMDYFQQEGIEAIEFNSLKDKKNEQIYKTSKQVLKDKFEKNKMNKIKSKTIRMMVVGIPNVGKSTFINNISRRRGTRVGNRPGVTRINQWIKTNQDMVLLDTPGVLWPKLDTPDKGLGLAFTGAIKDETLDVENLAFFLIERLNSLDKDILKNRYGVDTDLATIDIMDAIGRKSGALLKGNEIDYHRVANIILDDFRKKRLGRISLETVDQLGV